MFLFFFRIFLNLYRSELQWNRRKTKFIVEKKFLVPETWNEWSRKKLFLHMLQKILHIFGPTTQFDHFRNWERGGLHVFF